jgi:endonuclease YncB( thermonuclease family)
LFLPPDIIAQSMIIRSAISNAVDGSTVAAVLNGRQEFIRLNCVDAPERSQEYAGRSRTALQNFVEGETITLHLTGRDKYGRWIGTLYKGVLSVNLWMIENGHAKVSQEYCKDDLYSFYESQAKTSQVGLWAYQSQSEPWVYRPAAALTHSNGAPISTPVSSAKNTSSVAARPSGVSEATNGSGTPVGASPHIEVQSDGTEVWRSSGSANGRTVFTGPRGGKYTISPSGSKVYVKRK